MLAVSSIQSKTIVFGWHFATERGRELPDRISLAYNNPFVTKSYVTIDLLHVCECRSAQVRGKMRLSDARLPQRVAYLRGVASPASSTCLRLMVAPGPHLTGSQTRNVTRVFSLLTNQRTRRIVCSAFPREYASLTGNRFLSLCTGPCSRSLCWRMLCRPSWYHFQFFI